MCNHILDAGGQCSAGQLAQVLAVVPYHKTALHREMTLHRTAILHHCVKQHCLRYKLI